MQLIKYFHELSLHPNNAKELKGLILQLAVQGKLTTQWRLDNPEVESASILLDKIQKFKKEKSRLKKQKVQAPNIKNEINVDLPKGWVQVRNFDLFSLVKGKNPKDLSESTKKYLYQDIESLDRGNIRRYSDDENAPKCSDSDILVVCDGSRSGLVLDGKYGIVGSTLAIIETPPFIQNYIKVIFLQNFQRVNSNMIGAAIPHLDTKNLLYESVGLPPLEEQKAIVETVNQLFKEIEQLEQLTLERIQLKEQFATSALNQLATNNTVKEWAFLQEHFHPFFNHQPNIKKLRKTILQLAVQGILTRDFRASHPELREGSHSAAALLEQIKAEKARLVKEKKIKKENPLPPILEGEIPYELPEGWVWCRLGEILLYSDAGKSPDCEKRPSQNNEWGVLTTTSIQVNSFNEMANKILPVNYVINPNQVVKCGDILITRAGPINRTGIACKVNSINSNLILSDKTIRLNYPENLVNPDFVVSTLNSVTIRKILLQMMIGMASSQVNISQANIKTTSFPLPPLPEQKAIVETINRLMALCDQLEQEVQQSEQQVELVMKGVLREVFG
ncbi:MAG: hypothetical protein A2W85_10175 [Bacteroidetes bacterium GWF2_41_31]|nr:MAG: hypothetical protein A2W85_10175 [Bacteroidetes bacterium GWF2_41_31]OFZ07694.1 MAG: hypothetical protein A2338_03240 [Bacteroidetes bacterium RIFOXYB12_FULL_41_6]